MQNCTRRAALANGIAFCSIKNYIFLAKRVTPGQLKRNFSTFREEEKLSKCLKVVKSYTKIEELTPEILNSFIEKIYIGETEKYDGRKMQEVEIIYKFVGAINLPQYNSY